MNSTSLFKYPSGVFIEKETIKAYAEEGVRANKASCVGDRLCLCVCVCFQQRTDKVERSHSIRLSSVSASLILCRRHINRVVEEL